MSKRNKRNRKGAIDANIPAKGSSVGYSTPWLARVENWLEPRLKWVFGFALAIFLLIGFLLFDGFIIPMADDANFIVEASNFLKYGVYPSFSSVFYTAILAVPAFLFGFNVITYKLFSFVMASIGIWFFYKYFKQQFPHSVVLTVLLIIATNYGLQFYSSSTMSESFFMMMQYAFMGLLFFLMNKYAHVDLSAKWKDLDVKFWAAFGLFLVLYSITKNILIVAPIIAAVYFLLSARYKLAAMIIGVYAVFRAVYTVFIKVVFGASSVSGQWETLLLKNYYNAGEGKENVMGLISRYIANFNHYISNDLLRILGWRAEGMPLTAMPLFSLLFFACVMGVLYYSFKHKHDKIFFVGLYLIGTISVVFFALQAHWMQDRMILVFIPLILVFLLSGLFEFVKTKNSIWQVGYLCLLPLLFLVQLRHLPKKVSLNQPKLTAIMSGDIYGIYTPDWQHYLKMSKWTADNLPATSKVLCRKPNTSIVYADGKNIFEGLFRSTQESGDIVLANFQKQSATHLMVCNLRANPAQAVEGQVIGTTHSYLRSIYEYDPAKLVQVHTIGNTEPCFLYQINY